MKPGIYRQCRKRVVLAATVGAVVSSALPGRLAGEDAASPASETNVAAEQVDCIQHGGKVHTLRCAMRSLDRVPGGRWIKWAIGVAFLVGVPYLTIRRLVGLWRGPGSDPNKRDRGSQS